MNLDSQNVRYGETMFQYLKRKKKSVLDSTLNKNRKNSSYTEKVNNQNQHDYQQTKREESKENYNKSNLRNKNTETNSTTPKRLSILEEERRPATRSFLQMISPIRSKSPIQKQVENSLKISPKILKKDSYKDNYTKRMLIQKINTLRDIIESLVKAGKNLKQKCHFLFVDLKPFFRHIQTCNQSRFEKRTEEMKAQLKAVQPLFKEFNLDASQHCIDSFYQHFSQYLNQLEGNNLAQIQQIKNNATLDITNQKNLQIAQLKETNKKLQRQLSIMNKKCQKLEKCLQELKETTQLQVEEKRNQLVERGRKFEGDLTKLKEVNQDLKDKIEEMSAHIVELQHEKKQLKFDRVKYQQQCLNTITKVKSQQQQFLLNEIMVLKKQFNTDLTQMAQLHKIKEEEYLQRIKNSSIQIQKYKNKMQDMAQSTLQMEELMNTSKAQATRFKKQNQCLATDIHRINEELYQHWLALKDIKTLSSRLDIFYKFKKIYQQLAFNEQLFL